VNQPITLVVLVVVIAVVVIGAVAAAARARRQRDQAWADTALQLGFSSRPAPELLDRYGSLPFFQKGHSRKVEALFHGTPWGPEVWLGDYRWITGSGKSQHIHRVTFCLVGDPRLALPRFELAPEHPFVDKVATLFGLGDVDFDEDPEFSRAFRLTGADPAALRETFTATVRTQLLHRPERLAHLEGVGQALLLHPGRRIAPPTAHELLRQAQEIHAIFAG